MRQFLSRADNTGKEGREVFPTLTGGKLVCLWPELSVSLQQRYPGTLANGCDAETAEVPVPNMKGWDGEAI